MCVVGSEAARIHQVPPWNEPREFVVGSPRRRGSAVLVLVLVAQSCLTLCDPIDCSPPGSSVHGILQARILERIAIPFSRGSSQPRD